MSGQSRFWNYVGIVLFAGAVAALGAKELFREHGGPLTVQSSKRERQQARSLIESLRGKPTFERAGSGERAPRSTGASFKPSVNAAPVAKQNVARPAPQTSKQHDRLTRSDRRELGSLLDRVAGEN